MTYFVKFENGVPLIGIVIEENLRQVVPELAQVKIFTPELVEPHGYGIYDFSSKPANVGRYEKIVEVTPVRDARGIWMQTWATQPMTADEVVATDKAKDTIRMAVAKVCLFEPLDEAELQVNQTAMVLGGGISGMTSAKSLANQGYKTHLVERNY